MHIPRMSRQEIQSDLDSSLKRLDVDYVDLYWIHRDDPGTPAEEILLTLEELRQQGKFRCAGFSNWIQSRAEEARVAAERLGIPGFFASQNQWSLARADSAKGDPTWAYIDHHSLSGTRRMEWPLLHTPLSRWIFPAARKRFSRSGAGSGA
jgi:aryl-alcohol dehydrogenase-like predicted oxidoreductase